MSTGTSMFSSNNSDKWRGFRLPAQYGNFNPITERLKNIPSCYSSGQLYITPVEQLGQQTYESGKSSVGITYCQHTPVHR